MTAELWCVRAGQVPYQEARGVQERLKAARQADEIPDLLLLLEHPPVYTKGRRSTPAELPMGEDWYRMQGIEVCDTDRGGQVTYHGPGQLVGYPIMSLRPYGDDVHSYIRRMERTVVESLGAHRVAAGPIEGLTGVWTAGARPGSGAAGQPARKIASIGVHVSRGVTTHGFAVNVNNDLQPFEWIVPCGIEGCQVTSICREHGATESMPAFMDTVTEVFGRVYGRQPLAIDASALAERVEGVGALAAAPPVQAAGAGNGRPAGVR
jgi:lipoyl(octanoyl) transferase